MTKFITLSILLISLNSLANSYDWGEETNSATTIVDHIGMEVSIDLSSGGKQEIYINFHSNDYSLKVCSKSGEETWERSTIKVNGVNVKTFLFCRLYEPGIFYTVEVAETEKGSAYILKQFQKTTPVIIDGFAISTKGFNKIWDSFGGDAI